MTDSNDRLDVLRGLALHVASLAMTREITADDLREIGDAIVRRRGAIAPNVTPVNALTYLLAARANGELEADVAGALQRRLMQALDLRRAGAWDDARLDDEIRRIVTVAGLLHPLPAGDFHGAGGA